MTATSPAPGLRASPTLCYSHRHQVSDRAHPDRKAPDMTATTARSARTTLWIITGTDGLIDHLTRTPTPGAVEIDVPARAADRVISYTADIGYTPDEWIAGMIEDDADINIH